MVVLSSVVGMLAFMYFNATTKHNDQLPNLPKVPKSRKETVIENNIKKIKQHYSLGSKAPNQSAIPFKATIGNSGELGYHKKIGEKTGSPADDLSTFVFCLYVVCCSRCERRMLSVHGCQELKYHVSRT